MWLFQCLPFTLSIYLSICPLAPVLISDIFILLRNSSASSKDLIITLALRTKRK